MDSSAFFGTEAPEPDPQGYDRHGRYLLDADGTGQKSYTRATTLAKTLDAGIGLQIWGQRKAAKGVAMSPALTARAAVADLSDKDTWREILAQAEVKSGGDEKRDWGSAFHEFHERVPDMSDEEYAACAVELRVTYERYRAELDRLGIEEVLTEFTCVNTQIGTAGKGDAVFRLADGRLVIGDRKTGRVVEYPHSPAVQLAIYANADVLIEFDESGAQQRLPMPALDKRTAIIVDITVGGPETAAVHVYEIDIWAGWYGALLAGDVRRWRNRKDLIKPYHPELPPTQWVDQSTPWSPSPMQASVPTGAMEIKQEPPAPGSYAAAGTEVDPDGEKWADASAPRATPEQRAAFAAELPPSQVKIPTEVAHGPTANAPSAPTVADAHAAEADAAIAGRAAELQQAADHLGGPMTQQAHAAHPVTHQAWSSAEQRNITINADGSRADGLTGPQMSAIQQKAQAKVLAAGPINAASLPEVTARVADVDALLATFKTKAALQAAARQLSPEIKVERQRKNLAADMVAHSTWPGRRSEFLPMAQATKAALSAEADAINGVSPQTPLPGRDAPEEFSPVVTNAPGPVPPDPEPTVNLDAPGLVPVDTTPQANPFRPKPAATAPAKTKEDEFAEQIAQAATLEAIGDVWDAAQKAGIGWPARLHSAATIREQQLTNQ